jgi:hypothetical protein
MALTSTSAMGRLRATASASANNSIESIVMGPQEADTDSAQKAIVTTSSSSDGPTAKTREMQEKRDSFAKVKHYNPLLVTALVCSLHILLYRPPRPGWTQWTCAITPRDTTTCRASSTAYWASLPSGSDGSSTCSAPSWMSSSYRRSGR